MSASCESAAELINSGNSNSEINHGNHSNSNSNSRSRFALRNHSVSQPFESKIKNKINQNAIILVLKFIGKLIPSPIRADPHERVRRRAHAQHNHPIYSISSPLFQGMAHLSAAPAISWQRGALTGQAREPQRRRRDDASKSPATRERGGQY